MIIKEVFNDYKALYKMLNKRIDENEKEIKPETYFVREILKREDKNVKYIVSIIEFIIPLLLFIIIYPFQTKKECQIQYLNKI